MLAVLAYKKNEYIRLMPYIKVFKDIETPAENNSKQESKQSLHKNFSRS